MQITIKLFATLRKNREKQTVLEIAEGTTVGKILEQLKISEQEATILMLNGRNVRTDHLLKDKDTLSLFPPLGGG